MNILLTSVGRRTYLINYFKHALGNKGLVYASNSIFTYSLTQADGYVLTPQIYDEGYIAFLMKFCAEKRVSLVISLFDIDLPILAKNKKLFKENNIDIVVPDYQVTQICNDKWKTYNFLSNLGVAQPISFIDLEIAKQAILEDKIRFPLIIKPRWGMGSIGIYTAYNNEELSVLYNKVRHEIFETYLKYESASDINSSVLIQQMIEGQEYGIEILNDLQGNYVTTFAKKKIAMRSGETDVAETVSATYFLDISKKISEKLRHIGMLDADCFISGNGLCYVLEMNCRFGGQYPFTHNSGADVPQQIINWSMGMATDYQLLSSKIGVKSCKDLLPVIISE